MHAHDTTLRSKVNSLFESNLYNRPFCTNDYHDGARRNKNIALNYRMVEHNQPNSFTCMAFDLDYAVDPGSLDPLPNALIYNQANGKAHGIIILKTPVHANCFSSLKAQAYYKYVLKALTARYNADLAYTNFLCKNPFHKDFRPLYLTDELRDLDYLAEWIPANQPAFNPSKLKLENFLGLGRNSDMFHRGRFKSYIMIREYVDSLYRDFYEAVYEYCAKVNCEYSSPPLHINEVRATAKSIARWVFDRRFKLTNYSKQTARAKKLGRTRHEVMLKNKQEALTLLGQGLKVPEIARSMGLSERTIWNYISTI